MEEALNREAAVGREIENRLAQEPRDRAWATTAEDNLRRAVTLAAGDGGAYAIKALDCRTSLCKVALVLPASVGPAVRMTPLPSLVNGMAGFRFSRPKKLDNGTYETSYEFFRSGYPIPGNEVTP